MEELPETEIGGKLYTATLSPDCPPHFQLTIYEDGKAVFATSFKEKSWALNYYNNFLRDKKREGSCSF